MCSLKPEARYFFSAVSSSSFEEYGFIFVMAFFRPPTTNSVFQHLSSCSVTLETGESFGLFVGQEKAIVIAFGTLGSEFE